MAPHHSSPHTDTFRRILRGQDARDPTDESPLAYPLVATFLLTGGRLSEVLGLELDDISFARKTVTFRPNRWRRLKTSTSARVVPLWPQLEEILRDYLRSIGGDAPHGLLFSARGADGVGTVRHRAEVVEYRVEQHAEELGTRLTDLRALAAGRRE